MKLRDHHLKVLDGVVKLSKMNVKKVLLGEVKQITKVKVDGVALQKIIICNLLLDQKDLVDVAEEEVELELLEVALASSVVRKVICQENVQQEAEVELVVQEPASNVVKRVTSLENVLMEEAANQEVQ